MEKTTIKSEKSYNNNNNNNKSKNKHKKIKINKKIQIIKIIILISPTKIPRTQIFTNNNKKLPKTNKFKLKIINKNSSKGLSPYNYSNNNNLKITAI